MERISVRGLATAIRFLREPVVVTYSYPRNDPRYNPVTHADGPASLPGEELGVFLPMEEYVKLTGKEPGPGAKSAHEER